MILNSFFTELMFIFTGLVGAVFFGIGKDICKLLKSRLGFLFIFLSFVLLYIPLGFRARGIDHEIYYGWYEYADYWFLQNYHFSPEPFFSLLMMFAKYVVSNFQVVYLVSAFIFLWGIYKELFRKCDNGFVGLFFSYIYIFIYMCGITRMSIAIGIMSYSFKYLSDKKNTKRYFLLIFISFMFHYSSIIGVAIYYAYNRKKKIPIYYIGIVFFIMLIYNLTYEIWLALLPSIFSRYEPFSLNNISISTFQTFIVILPALLFYIIYSKIYADMDNRLIIDNKDIIGSLEKYSDKSKNGLNNIIILIFIMIVLAFFNGSMYRFLFFFTPFIAYIYSIIGKVLRKQSDNGILYFIFVAGLIVIGIVYIHLLLNGLYINKALVPFEINFNII